MKKFTIILAVFGLFMLSSQTAKAQCKTFAKGTCKTELLPFVHDGIYNATVLSEGETVELYKTFYSGQDYRIVVCGDENLPPIEFQILDGDRNVLFDNREANLAKVWDFKLSSSQMLVVSIQVQTSEEMSDEIKSGCVAVLVGFMNIENKLE
ncbi:MAG: hypothetical protein JXR60_05435 [Bacteroidales bacterium]|nr:hypothetical protein [Bacteroidales bacterium]